MESVESRIKILPESVASQIGAAESVTVTDDVTPVSGRAELMGGHNGPGGATGTDAHGPNMRPVLV